MLCEHRWCFLTRSLLLPTVTDSFAHSWISIHACLPFLPRGRGKGAKRESHGVFVDLSQKANDTLIENAVRQTSAAGFEKKINTGHCTWSSLREWAEFNEEIPEHIYLPPPPTARWPSFTTNKSELWATYCLKNLILFLRKFSCSLKIYSGQHIVCYNRHDLQLRR